MSEVILIIRTADQTRKAEVSLNREQTGGDVIQAAVDNWSLPTDTDYSLVNTSSSKAIDPNQALDKSIVADNDILEVQPVLVAGSHR